MSLPPKIDVHAHFVPPCWRQALIENGLEKADGMPGIPVRKALGVSFAPDF